jgi:iron complex outermembrane receptor protein
MSSRIKLAFLMLAATSTPALASGGSGGANDSGANVQPAAVASQADPSSSDQLQEITVTARKSNEKLNDVPLAITVVTAENIAARGITDLTQIASFTPGLTFQSQSIGRNDRGFKQYIIRGMIPNSALASRQTVSVFVDGAPVDGGNISGVTDVEQVEVIKGPQSAFFGRSTFAGAINISTKAPSYDVHASANLQYSTFNTTDFSASMEGGIIPDKLAIRVAGRVYHTDGDYKDDVYQNIRLGRQNTRSISVSLLAQPTPTLRIRAFATHWTDDDGLAANALLGASQQNCNTGVTKYYCGAVGELPSSTRTWNQTIIPAAFAALQTGSTLYGADFQDHLGLHRSAQQYRATVEQELGDWMLSGVGSASQNKWGFLQTVLGADYRNVPNPNPRTNTQFPYNYLLILGNTKDHDRYGELRLASPKNKPLSGTLGVNYAFAQTDNLTALDGYTGYVLATPHTINSSNTYGVFGSLRWNIMDRLSISGEGRYQIDKIFQQTLAGSNPSYAATFRAFTPRAILQYEPRPNTSIYVSYAKGNRPGEFNTIYQAEPAYVQAIIRAQSNVALAVKEETVRMAEAGFKGNLFDNRVRLLLAGYVGWWDNRHVPNNITYTDQNNGLLNTVQITTASGTVNLHGVELETDIKASANIDLSGTFDWAASKIKRSFSADALALTGNANQVGNRLPYYPSISASGSATYHHQLFDDYGGYIRGDIQYVGRIYESEANLAWTKPAATVNLRVGIQNTKYQLEVYSDNLGNNKTPTSIARVTQSLYSATGASLGSANGVNGSLPVPRTIGVRFNVKY